MCRSLFVGRGLAPAERPPCLKGAGFLRSKKTGGFLCRKRHIVLRTIPRVAVPGSFLAVDAAASSADRGPLLRSLYPPLAALPSQSLRLRLRRIHLPLGKGGFFSLTNIGKLGYNTQRYGKDNERKSTQRYLSREPRLVERGIEKAAEDGPGVGGSIGRPARVRPLLRFEAESLPCVKGGGTAQP